MADQPSSKWREKQRIAKEAEAKFAANQARAGKRKGTAAQLDEMAAGLAIDRAPPSLGERVFGFLLAHRKAVIAVLAVIIVGGIVFGVCQVVKHQLRTAPGTPIDELFVASPAGDVLIVIDHVTVGGGTDSRGRVSSKTAEGRRLIALDARTGKQLGVIVEDFAECWVGGARVWCRDKLDELHLLDPRTLATVATAKALIAKAGLGTPTRRSQREGDDVVVVLGDGRGARISPVTLGVTVVDTVIDSWRPPRTAGDCATTRRLALGPATLVLASGGTRNRLTTEPPPPAEGAPSDPSLTFLEGAFLVTRPGIPLVLHGTQIGAAQQQIARVDSTSRQRWNHVLSSACRHAQVSGGILVVAVDDRDHRAIGIDLETGAVAWQFSL